MEQVQKAEHPLGEAMSDENTSILELFHSRHVGATDVEEHFEKRMKIVRLIL